MSCFALLLSPHFRAEKSNIKLMFKRGIKQAQSAFSIVFICKRNVQRLESVAGNILSPLLLSPSYTLLHTHTSHFFCSYMHPIMGNIGQLLEWDALEELLCSFQMQPVALLTSLQTRDSFWETVGLGHFMGNGFKKKKKKLKHFA